MSKNLFALRLGRSDRRFQRMHTCALGFARGFERRCLIVRLVLSLARLAQSVATGVQK